MNVQYRESLTGVRSPPDRESGDLQDVAQRLTALTVMEISTREATSLPRLATAAGARGRPLRGQDVQIQERSRPSHPARAPSLRCSDHEPEPVNGDQL